MDWNLRNRYGEVYVTSFPEGIDVPWKPLSYGDFIYYNEIISEGRVPPVIFHEEIFRKCVVNPVFTHDLDELEAGTVEIVAEDILNASGPFQPDLFNQDLDVARKRASLYIHQISTLICQAFPAYIPEDVMAMEYDAVLLRLAQAEEILIKAGILKEPISMFDSHKPKKKKMSVSNEVLKAWERTGKNPKDIPPETDKSRKIKDAWERTNKVALPKEIDTSVKPPDPNSPLLQKHDKIDFGKDNKELGISGGVSGWDKQDMPIIQHKMIENAKKIYPYLFDKNLKKPDPK